MRILSLLMRFALSLAVICTGGAAFARDNPFPQVMRWVMGQATIMQAQYGSVASCRALQDDYIANGWPRGASFETLDQIDRRVKKGVILQPDPSVDTWTPLTKTLIEGKRRPAADCDDVAVSSAQLAICAGFPSDQMGLLVTQYPGKRELHVVAFYADPATGVWIFGDTMNRARPLSQLGQKLHYYAYVDDITHWWALRDPFTGKVLTDDLPTSSIPGPEAAATVDTGTCRTH